MLWKGLWTKIFSLQCSLHKQWQLEWSCLGKDLDWWAVVTKVSALMAYVVNFRNIREHVIRSKCFFEVPFLSFLALHAEGKVWPDGTHLMLFT